MTSFMRLGMSLSPDAVHVVVSDADGEVLGSASGRSVAPHAEMGAVIEQALEGTNAEAVSQAILSDLIPPAAILTEHQLGLAGVLRIAGPTSLAVPPAFGWPADLSRAILGPTAIIAGGHEHDGTLISPLDENGVLEFTEQCVDRGITSIAVSSPFAPAWPAHELRAEEILNQRYGSLVRITLSHRIGSLNLIERENAALLNAAIVAGKYTVIDRFMRALRTNGITAEPHVSLNDGSLVSAQDAAAHPLRTLGSARATAIHGARLRSGLSNAMIIDVDENEMRIGVLNENYPRLARVSINLGGVPTNVRVAESIDVPFPHRSVASPGASHVGSSSELGGWVASRVERSIARLWHSPEPVDAVVIGSGRSVVPLSIPGVRHIVVPDISFSIHAYGAAMAEACGAIDKIYLHDARERDRHIHQAQRDAVETALRAGADPDQTRVISVLESPITYLPIKASRVVARASGPLLD